MDGEMNNSSLPKNKSKRKIEEGKGEAEERPN
jgi:hypothetical protein